MDDYKQYGDYTWLFAGDHVINMRQVRRFSLERNTVAGNNVSVYYIGGTVDYFIGESAAVIWKALCKASENVNVPVSRSSG